MPPTRSHSASNPASPLFFLGLRQLPNAFLTSIDRGGSTIHAVAPDEVLEEGDVLWFAGGTGWLGTVLRTTHSASLCGLPARQGGMTASNLEDDCLEPHAPPKLATNPSAAGNAASVRFIRNTPGLTPLAESQASKLRATQTVERRLVQAIIAT